MTAKEFKEALKEVYEKDLDKIIEHKYNDYTEPRSYIKQEIKRAKLDKAFLDYYVKSDIGIEDMPYIVLLMEIKSTEVLKNVICRMTKGE